MMKAYNTLVLISGAMMLIGCALLLAAKILSFTSYVVPLFAAGASMLVFGLLVFFGATYYVNRSK